MTGRNIAVALGGLFFLLAPLFGTDFFIDFVLTRTLMLGLAASTIVFLSAYGGMDSLAQWLIFGIAGFAYGNMVADSGRGLTLGWNPWLAIPIAIIICTLVSLLLGAVGARSTGI